MMKNLFLATSLMMLSISTFAAKLPADIVEVKPITQMPRYVLSDTSGSCTPGSMCTPTSIMTVEFTLSGCMNVLGPVSYYIENKGGGSLDVYVSAVELVTRRSQSARCLLAPTAQSRLILGIGSNNESDVRLHILNNIAN